MFKKILMTVGILAIVLVVGGGIFFWMLAKEGVEADETSRAYVETNLKKLAEANWYGKVFAPMAHPLLQEAVTQKQWHDLSVSYYHTLGPLVQFGTCEGQASINFGDDGKEVSAAYECGAQFQNGDAVIRVNLLKDGEAWKIVRLFVNSDLFVK